MSDFDWRYPLHFDPATGDYALVRIGSGAEKGGCAAHIADTPLGTERARPDFGRPELAFGQGEQGQREAAAILQAAVDRQEPRVAGLYDIVLEPAEDGVGAMTIDVRAVPDDTTDEVAE